MSSEPDRDPVRGDRSAAEHRASDADRDLTAAQLREAFGDGRLTQQEHEERLDAVWNARTLGELDGLTADLPRRTRSAPDADPASTANPPAVRPDGAPVRPARSVWGAWAGMSVLVLGIWGITSVMSGELLYFWPIYPVGIVALVLIALTLGGFGRPGGHPGPTTER